MNKLSLLALGLLVAVVTGCPRDYYDLELTPRDAALERQLVFYRADGSNSNGVPNYQTFSQERLVAITGVYQSGSLTTDGKKHLARAEFAEAMPKDIGGAGSWTNLITSLGSAAIYAERFRGYDDFASTTAKRLVAVDQLTDLILGWSKTQLGREPLYENLRRFLDTNFRHDLKNLTLYNWTREVASQFDSKANEEFIVRFAQYLTERGYFKLSQLPEFFAATTKDEDRAIARLIQRFIASKMGVSESEPLPQCLAFLEDKDAVNASWEKFLATTEAYQVRVKKWEEDKKSKPDLEKPKPADVVQDLFVMVFDFHLFGSTDQLTVKLLLPAAPIRTNGKWDKARRQVLWEFDLDDKDETPRLPAFCYANWSVPNESFQTEHFGKVILTGDELQYYCLWRAGVSEKQAQEWEAFLLRLKPASSLIGTLEAFRFSDEPTTSAGTPQNGVALASDLPRSLLKTALQEKPSAGAK